MDLEIIIAIALLVLASTMVVLTMSRLTGSYRRNRDLEGRYDDVSSLQRRSRG